MCSIIIIFLTPQNHAWAAATLNLAEQLVHLSILMSGPNQQRDYDRGEPAVSNR